MEARPGKESAVAVTEETGGVGGGGRGKAGAGGRGGTGEGREVG